MTEAVQTRREFLRSVALQAALATVAAYLPGVVFEAPESLAAGSSDLAWKKSPCRFCGTGCGLLIGIEKGRAVAVKGDPASTVNRGLLCVKGYHSVLALYGSDRLTQALVRKDGKLVPVPVSEALDLVADRLKRTMADHGKDSVAIYGSGQWTIPEGYAASKLFKGGLGTNNVEANARLCMASAVTGFMTTFGMDEPMGCYEDIDHADVFVLWGNNMAEMHPVLFSRLLARRQAGKRVHIVDLATRRTRTSRAADVSLMFKPQTDLAIANAIAWVIINEGRHNETFVAQCCQFMSGKTSIGYGLEDDFKFKDEPKPASFAEYKKFLEDYRPEIVEKLSGVSAKDLRYLASLYGDPGRKVTSFWCMGMNQHTRGTWINNLVYNLHLLTGKIASPGNSPFSLTGQPSACGTVREVGTLTNRLPHGTVDDPHAREVAAKIWNVPVERIPDKPTYHTVAMFRALDAGKIRFLWIQTTNPMVTMPNLKRYRDASLKEDRFIVVSDVYPTPTTAIADVILPSAFWIEREGMFGNSERRTQHFEKMIEPPGDALPDAWQLIEVARRLGLGALFPYDKATHAKELFEEYRKFHEGPAHNLATYEQLRERPGVMWPIVDGKETKWRYNPEYDPAAKAGASRDFYGNANRRANIWLRPYEPAPEAPDQDYPFWLDTGRVLEHWHSGSLTRRIDVLHQARPHAYVEVNRKDAERLGLRHGEKARLTSRRGRIDLPVFIDERGDPPEGQVFVPFFDEGALINELTLDAYCPFSAQPDYKKCAVKVERV